MNLNMNTPSEVAYLQGRTDLRQALEATLADAGPLNIGEARVVIDGSQYSPSHRVLPRADHWWRHADIDEAAWEAYTQGVDFACDNNDAIDAGLSVYWDEGMLWIEAPGPEEMVA